MSNYTLTTTPATYPLYNLMWLTWQWKSVLGFTYLGFYLESYPTYFIEELKNNEFESQISLISSLLSPLPPPPPPLPPPPPFPLPLPLPPLSPSHWWSPTVARHYNHCHTKSLLCKWVHWTLMTFQILNLDT